MGCQTWPWSLSFQVRNHQVLTFAEMIELLGIRVNF